MSAHGNFATCASPTSPRPSGGGKVSERYYSWHVSLPSDQTNSRANWLKDITSGWAWSTRDRIPVKKGDTVTCTILTRSNTEPPINVYLPYADPLAWQGPVLAHNGLGTYTAELDGVMSPIIAWAGTQTQDVPCELDIMVRVGGSAPVNLVNDPGFARSDSFTGLSVLDGQALPKGGNGRVTVLRAKDSYILNRNGGTARAGRMLAVAVWARATPGTTITRGSRMDINLSIGPYQHWMQQYYATITDKWQLCSGIITTSETGEADICIALRGSEPGMSVQLYKPQIYAIN